MGEADPYDHAFDVLIGHEGGYADNPADPGGETNFGICRRSYPDLDIRNLTAAEAKAIYRRDYWTRTGCADLPGPLAILVFDAAVNNGQAQAARWLQGALGVAQDGQVGPVTLKAARARPALDLAVEFHATRLYAMTQMPGWDGGFGRGWSRRLVRLALQSVGAL